MSSELANSASAVAIESFVTRGDWSQLSPLDRARAYTHVCAQHGLNPMSQPFAFLRLNGKEVLYATRGATDQLAAMHKVTRKIIDGPKVIDIAGSKVAYCVAEASLPGGRSETATATLPVADPVNLYMKLETKAKRRATIALLGLAMLDETELTTIPAGAQEAAPQPSREDLSRVAEEPVSPLVSWRTDLADCTTVLDARVAFLAHRADLGDEAKDATADVRQWCERKGIYLDAAGVVALLATLPEDALRCLDHSRGGSEAALVEAGRWCRGAEWDEHSQRVVWSALARGYQHVTGAKSPKVAAEALRDACEEEPLPPDGTDGPANGTDEGEGADAEGSAAPQQRAAEGPRASLRVVREWTEEDLVTSAAAWREHIGAAANAYEVRASFRKRASAFTREGVYALREEATLVRLAELGIDAPRAFLHAPPTARKRQGDKAA